VDESCVAIEYLRATFPEIDWHNCRIHEYLRMPRIHDGITLYHVLEHIPEPAEVCHLVRERLRSGGLLVVEVPDVGSGQARLYGDRWGMYLPDHINYFTASDLRRLLERIGFQLVDQERKYHFGWPSGNWWKDVLHKTLSKFGIHSIVTTYWRLSN
jgi:hypothetical protein